MKNYLLIITYFLLAFDLSAQTQRFSSENIDSLLKAYNSHQAIALPKAYCLDQMVRFYSNPPQDLEKASEYMKAYKSISEALENTDLSTRYQYRYARLNFLLSEKHELDTATYTLVYKYFKANDPKFCIDISTTMVNYVSKSDSYSPKSEEDRPAFLKWMTLHGDDQMSNNAPLKAGKHYWISSRAASYEHSKQAQILCRKAIKAYQEGEAAPSEIYEAYYWLSDLVFYSRDSSSISVLEKEVSILNKKAITNSFESMRIYHTQGDVIQKEKNELKAQRLLSVRDSSRVVKLPQGTFCFDEYDGVGLREHRKVRIVGETMSMDVIDTSGDIYTSSYKVMRSYPVRGKITVLAVDILKEEEESNHRIAYFIMHYLNQRLVIDGIYNHDSNVPLLERESKIDEMLLSVKNRILEDKRYDSLMPLNMAYFNESEYKRLNELPRISKDQFEELKADFTTQLEPSDEKDYSAYELFILNAEGQYGAADAQLVLLREMMIEKGFNPFSSIPYFVAKEAEHVDGPNDGGGLLLGLVFLFGMLLNQPGVNYILIILGILGIIWAIYRLVKSNTIRKKDNPEALATSQKSFFRGLINIIGIGGLMIAGGFIGFWTGWNISDNDTGGGTIITIGVALFFIPVGAILGFILGSFLLLKREKTKQQSDK